MPVYIRFLTLFLLLFGQILVAASPEISLTASPNPAILGQPVVLTASTPSGGSGLVTYYDGSTVLGVANLAQGKSVFTTSLLPAGARQLRAFYPQAPSGPAASNIVNLQVQARAGFGFQPVTLPVGARAQSIATGDFNGDGKPDLAVVDSTQVTILLNAGHGAFTAGASYAEQNPSRIVAADFNNDGRTDLAVLEGGPKTVAILLGKGDGTFQAAGNNSVGALPGAIVVGDFNGDGNADIATANSNSSDPSHALSILLGKGDGTFAKAVDYPATGDPTSIAAADFNGDGYTDLAIPDASNSVTVFLGKGDGSFQAGPVIDIGYWASSVAVADFNEDSKPDLVIGLFPLVTQAPLNLIILLGNGDGSFRRGPDFSSIKGLVLSLAVGEFNGDNHADVVIGVGEVPNTGTVHVLNGVGDGTFHDATDLKVTPPGPQTGQAFETTAVLVSDFDGDGRDDIAFTAANAVPPGVLLAVASNQLSVVGTALPAGMVGVPYSAVLVATGGAQPYVSWQIVSGGLPTGLSLDGARGIISGTPAYGANGSFQFTLSVNDSSGNSAQASISLTIQPPVPAINDRGVTTIYNALSIVQPGAWASIYGTNLAAQTATWNGDFPTTLGGVTVKIDGKPAYLWYVSPTQINLQVPDDSAFGPVPVTLANVFGMATASVTLLPASPSMSRLSNGSLAGVIPTPDGSGAYAGGTYDLLGTGGLPFPTRPVRPGESLLLYGTGFGDTNPHIPAGTNPAAAAPAVGTTHITIGGVPAPVSFAGIVSAGLFQFNITVPLLPHGSESLSVSFSGPGASALLTGLIVPVQ